MTKGELFRHVEILEYCWENYVELSERNGSEGFMENESPALPTGRAFEIIGIAASDMGLTRYDALSALTPLTYAWAQLGGKPELSDSDTIEIFAYAAGYARGLSNRLIASAIRK